MPKSSTKAGRARRAELLARFRGGSQLLRAVPLLPDDQDREFGSSRGGNRRRTERAAWITAHPNVPLSQMKNTPLSAAASAAKARKNTEVA